MRLLPALLSGCIGLVPATSCAQGTNANWYFGTGAGLHFAGNAAPVPLAGNANGTLEGTACISDTLGRLLFYTDGVGVYDSNGQFMPNGGGLDGDASSTQSALIVRDPGNADRYYVFTVAAEASISSTGYTGLAYSTVEMDLNNGLGDVVLKNVPLVAPTCEKLTAVRHANGRDVWVIAHGFGNNAYHAFRITCAGIEAPVTSNAGRRMGPGAEGNEQAIGQLDVSPDGRFAAAIWRRGSGNGLTHVAIDVLSFNAADGTLALLDSITHAPPGADTFGFGACFAPGSRFLYTSEGGSIVGAPVWRIHQYDMQAADIAASEVRLVDLQDANFGAMACGPDGAIYVADPFTIDRLRVIRSPDLLGLACGLDLTGIDLNGQIQMGLPNVWENTPFFPADPLTLLLDDTTACSGPVVLTVRTDPAVDGLSYRWNTGSTTAAISADTAGRYVVEVVAGCDTLQADATVRFAGKVLDLGADQQPCEGNGVPLEVPSWAAAWAWADGATERQRVIDASTILGLAVVDSLGCASSDSLILAFADCDCRPYVPNAFTPDGDGLNDVWGAVLHCRHGPYHLTVFDRWGGRVFDSGTPEAAWDGTAQGTRLPAGVYAWRMDLAWQDPTGTRSTHMHGHVVLVR